MLLPWIVTFSLLGSLGAIALAGTLLRLPDVWRQRLMTRLLSYAIGTLLGAAFVELLPHAPEKASAQTVFGAVPAPIATPYLKPTSPHHAQTTRPYPLHG